MPNYPDFILYARDEAGHLWRSDAILLDNSDGDSVVDISIRLYDLRDDGETVQVIRLDRQNPANSADVTADVVAHMQGHFNFEVDDTRDHHPLIAEWADQEIAARTIRRVA